MPETIKASEQNLDKVFCDDYLFTIPLYQRPYAWTTDEVGDLLDDLLFAMDRGDEAPYFLGSIVLIKSDSADSQVIDGQQRLTTLTILLCTLRELADESIRTALDERIRQRRDPLSGAQEIVRLSIRSRDQNFFHTNIQSDSGIRNMLENTPEQTTDSQRRIFENAKFLFEKLSDLDKDKRERLATFIIRYCYLVIVSTTDMSSAYRIFSVMNDRGLDLEPTDILKAEIIGDINETDQSGYSDKWENIEQELGRERFGALFSHIRMICAKAKARHNLQDEFKEFVLQGSTSIEFIDRILEPYADAYKEVIGVSSHPPGDVPEFIAYLEYLRRLDNVDWIPPAIVFFHSNSCDKDRLIFVKNLERLAYGLFIRRANINERIQRYATVLHAIEQGDAIRQDNSPLQLRADEQETIIQTLDGPVYTLPRVPQPLLLRLDGLLADEGARYHHSVISIEHVLPQNPDTNSQWCRWFPDDEERAQWTHRLANLVLLSRRKNAAASNFDFTAKKSEYFHRDGVTPFALTTQVSMESEWTPEVLQRRQSELLHKLKQEWRLD